MLTVSTMLLFPHGGSGLLGDLPRAGAYGAPGPGWREGLCRRAPRRGFFGFSTLTSSQYGSRMIIRVAAGEGISSPAATGMAPCSGGRGPYLSSNCSAPSRWGRKGWLRGVYVCLRLSPSVSRRSPNEQCLGSSQFRASHLADTERALVHIAATSTVYSGNLLLHSHNQAGRSPQQLAKA